MRARLSENIRGERLTLRVKIGWNKNRVKPKPFLTLEFGSDGTRAISHANHHLFTVPKPGDSPETGGTQSLRLDGVVAAKVS